jgi:hypothetical protein
MNDDKGTKGTHTSAGTENKFDECINVLDSWITSELFNRTKFRPGRLL